jgi:hypothetical protein
MKILRKVGTVKKSDATNEKLVAALYSSIMRDIENVKMKLDKARTSAIQMSNAIEDKNSTAYSTAKELTRQVEVAIKALDVID